MCQTLDGAFVQLQRHQMAQQGSRKGQLGFRDWHWNPKFSRNTLALCLGPGATTTQVAAVGLPLIALRLGRRHLGNRMDIQGGKGYDGFCKESRVS